MRTCRVSMLFERIHALKGDMAGPVCRAKKRISFIKSFLPKTTPPITRPCPSKYLVAEWVTKSAPCLAGFCKYGGAKQLSTFKIKPCFLDNFPSHSKSAKSRAGLEGVSTIIILVEGVISFSHNSGDFISTSVWVILKRGKIADKIWCVEPKTEREANTWSPELSSPAMAR